MAETSYAKCGDLCVAYQVFGDGPVELVFAGPFVSHIELFWTLPEIKAFMERLATAVYSSPRRTAWPATSSSTASCSWKQW